MHVQWSQLSVRSGRFAASALLRALGVVLVTACLVLAPAEGVARGHGKTVASKKAKHKKPGRAKDAATTPPTARAPVANAPQAPSNAVPLAATATPTTAVALPHPATAAAAPVQPASAKAPRGPIAKPAAKTPEALPTSPAVAAVPNAHPIASASEAHDLPAAVSATTPVTPAKPRTNAAPVATASALPPVPAAKLQSDVRFESIVRLIQASKFGAALAEVDALLEKSPNDDELRVQRARLLYWLDRRQAAREYLAPLQARHPEDAEIRELDAQLKLADGDLVGALAQYRALEIAGDGRVELHQRIIDLSLELEESDAVTKSLKFGGHLSEEQDMAYTRLVHPWFADVAGTTTLHSGSAWWRGDAHLGRRINKRWSALLGAIVEQRYSGADLAVAEAVKGELYFGFSRIDGMLHIESSPNRSFLPVFDGRADLSLSLVKAFSLGLYGRFADYVTTATSQTRPSSAWTLAPNVIFYVKDWTLQPGYMLMNLAGANTTATSYFHTGFLKARWEPHPRWMAFAWLYFGTDPTFVERYGVVTATGASLVLGGEHWWTPRWGTRLSASRVQPFDSRNDSFTDVTLVLRGRL